MSNLYVVSRVRHYEGKDPETHYHNGFLLGLHMCAMNIEEAKKFGTLKEAREVARQLGGTWKAEKVV